MQQIRYSVYFVYLILSYYQGVLVFDFNVLLDPGYSTPRCIFCSYVAVNDHFVLSDAGDTLIDLNVTYYMSVYRPSTCLTHEPNHRSISQ